MATYGEIIDECLLLIPNPEWEPLLRRKINAVIDYISKSGYFWRDLEEVIIGSDDGVDATLYIQSIPITTTIRAIGYLQYPDRTIKISKLTAEEVAESWEEQPNCCYLSGNTLHIKHQYLSSTFKFGYYTSPTPFDVGGDDDENSNWITELCSTLVVDLAVSYVLALKGEHKDSQVIVKLNNIMQPTYLRDFVNSIIT